MFIFPHFHLVDRQSVYAETCFKNPQKIAWMPGNFPLLQAKRLGFKTYVQKFLCVVVQYIHTEESPLVSGFLKERGIHL